MDFGFSHPKSGSKKKKKVSLELKGLKIEILRPLNLLLKIL